MLNNLVDIYLIDRARITWIFNKFYDHSIIIVNIETIRSKYEPLKKIMGEGTRRIWAARS